MKIILGMAGSGKSRKIIELVAKDVEENKKAKIFSNDVFGEEYIVKMKEYGIWDPNLINVEYFNRGTLYLLNAIIKGFKQEEFDSVYVDTLSVTKNISDLNLLHMIEKYTGISIYISTQVGKMNPFVSAEKPLVVLDWEEYTQF